MATTAVPGLAAPPCLLSVNSQRGGQACRGPRALLLGLLPSGPSSPSSHQVSGTGLASCSGAEQSRLCVLPPGTLEAEGAFFRTLKWLLKVSLAAAQQWLERQVEGSGSPKQESWGLARPGFGPNGFD